MGFLPLRNVVFKGKINQFREWRKRRKEAQEAKFNSALEDKTDEIDANAGKRAEEIANKQEKRTTVRDTVKVDKSLEEQREHVATVLRSLFNSRSQENKDRDGK